MKTKAMLNGSNGAEEKLHGAHKGVIIEQS